MKPDAIPLELREIPQWVGWSHETRRGKSTKVPRIAGRPQKRASVADSTTWAPQDNLALPLKASVGAKARRPCK